MTSEIFKLKGLFEQVRNDFIRDAEERLEAQMTKEATEKAEREAIEKAAKEAAEKASAEVVAREKAEQEAEVAMVTEAAQKVASKKTTEVTLTQGESLTTDFAPLVIKTLEELQKEHQLVRARLDKQDQVNTSIHNILAELLHSMPPPPNP